MAATIDTDFVMLKSWLIIDYITGEWRKEAKLKCAYSNYKRMLALLKLNQRVDEFTKTNTLRLNQLQLIIWLTAANVFAWLSI